MPKQVGNVRLMQKMNRLRVLNYIRRNPDTSRPVISQHTGLSLASITNITAYLLDIGMLTESGIEPANRVGRKTTLLRFSNDAHGLIIASLTGTCADIFYTTPDGEIIDSCSDSIKGMSSEMAIECVLKLVCDLLNKRGKERTLAIGINFSGLVLGGSRFVVSSSMKWKEMDIKRLFEEKTGLPVFVENISRLKAVGYCISRTDHSDHNLVFVDLENGIGAVRITEGAVCNSVLGEIGHTTVCKDGPECFCGNNGCLEAVCSAEHLIKEFSDVSGNKVTSLSDFDLACKSGNKDALEALDECSSYLSIGLANLITLFNPASLVISKGQFSSCPSVIEKAVSLMKKRVYPALIADTDICLTDVDLAQTIKGAAFELCDRLFDISYPGNPIE